MRGLLLRRASSAPTLPAAPAPAPRARKAALVLAYDGRFFRGSQAQASAETVDGVLAHALLRAAPRPGSSWSRAARTDAGVHAVGAVVALRTALVAEGYTFVSETDTEVFAHLVCDVRKKHPALDLESVVRLALASVEGAFGVCFIFADRPDLLIGARHGSPLLLGVGDGEFFLASDASAVVEHTKTVEYLKEREMVSISSAGYVISSLDVAHPDARAHELVKIDLSLEAIEKGGYKHFMLKEIMEQPRALRDAMRGRINADTGELHLGGLAGEPMARMARARRIIIAACGLNLIFDPPGFRPPSNFMPDSIQCRGCRKIFESEVDHVR
jgi:tRNA pseudouridine(38-40) synthase